MAEEIKRRIVKPHFRTITAHISGCSGCALYTGYSCKGGRLAKSLCMPVGGPNRHFKLVFNKEPDGPASTSRAVPA